jgi:hypothetical protein
MWLLDPSDRRTHCEPRKLFSVSRRVAVLLIVLTCKSPGIAFPGGICDAKLVGNSYDCNVSFQTGEVGPSLGTRTESCVEFVTGGLSSNFDLVGSGNFVSGDYGCECEVTTSINSKFFDASGDAFECVGDPVNLVQLHGKVDSDRIRGQGSEANGSIIQFVCRKRSTACE